MERDKEGDQTRFRLFRFFPFVPHSLFFLIKAVFNWIKRRRHKIGARHKKSRAGSFCVFCVFYGEIFFSCYPLIQMKIAVNEHHLALIASRKICPTLLLGISILSNDASVGAISAGLDTVLKEPAAIPAP